MFHRLGYNTFIFDYRGYGESSGSPSESGTYLDAQAAWRYLTEKKAILPASIVLFGESLGGAIAAWLAANEKPASAGAGFRIYLGTRHGGKNVPFLPVRLLSRFEYSTIDYLQTLLAQCLSRIVRRMKSCRSRMARRYIRQRRIQSSFWSCRAATTMASFSCGKIG